MGLCSTVRVQSACALASLAVSSRLGQDRGTDWAWCFAVFMCGSGFFVGLSCIETCMVIGTRQATCMPMYSVCP